MKTKKRKSAKTMCFTVANCCLWKNNTKKMTYTIISINQANEIFRQKFSYDTEDLNEAKNMFDEDNFNELLSIKEDFKIGH